MKKTLAIVLAAIFSAACGGTAGNANGPMDQRTRDAMPTSDTVAMNTPDSSSSSARAAHPESAVGDPSVFLADTVDLGVSVNGAVIFTLGLLKSITDLPASACTATSCTWGPGALALDPVSWEFVVTYDSNANSYDYTLSGEAKAGGDGQMHPVVTGSATPSAVLHRGSGNFTIDFDEAKVLNPNNSGIGKLQVTYSNATVGQASINATFLGVNDQNHAGQTDNAIYAYGEDGNGGGNLQVAVRNLISSDILSMDSRWVASGAGRADVVVTITDGSGGAYSATESECWASSTSVSPAPFHVVYFTSSDAANLGPDSGLAANCAFPTAQTTSLSAP